MRPKSAKSSQISELPVALPVALCFYQGLLNSGNEGFVPLHDEVQLPILLFLLLPRPLFHQSLQGLSQPSLSLSSFQVLAQGLQDMEENQFVCRFAQGSLFLPAAQQHGQMELQLVVVVKFR